MLIRLTSLNLHQLPLASSWRWELDGWIVLVGILCAVASSLVGCFLVLRRMSMLGDAISHAILPGLAAAFFISGSRDSLSMFIGAVIVGVLTALLTEWIRSIGKVDEGASMGVVFTTLFALGLLMIVRAADHVDLDASCVLYGSLENVGGNPIQILGLDIPKAAITLSAVLLLNLVCIGLLFKELRLASFDAGLADAMGFNSRFLHYLLMVLVAITAVASFESVGNILVVAMMVVPTATALQFSNRLGIVLLLSTGIAIACAIVGHWSASAIPNAFGFPSVPTAGMMASVAGVFFSSALVFSPKSGLIARLLRRQGLRLAIVREDLLACLYRLEETDELCGASIEKVQIEIDASPVYLKFALWQQTHRQYITCQDDIIKLTDLGKSKAIDLIRSHRLWESYLLEKQAVSENQLHKRAHQLEHFTNDELRKMLDNETNSPSLDPHGKPIPEDTENHLSIKSNE